MEIIDRWNLWLTFILWTNIFIFILKEGGDVVFKELPILHNFCYNKLSLDPLFLNKLSFQYSIFSDMDGIREGYWDSLRHLLFLQIYVLQPRTKESVFVVQLKFGHLACSAVFFFFHLMFHEVSPLVTTIRNGTRKLIRQIWFNKGKEQLIVEKKEQLIAANRSSLTIPSNWSVYPWQPTCRVKAKGFGEKISRLFSNGLS